ncbi:hypothetical protein PSUM_04155 [Pseudomonas umsongensis]|uniref:Uncharacterized protein n=1 Tax=Pseudomonas umsongensis TaxID=198618 RepID=A0ABX4E0C2_9PSED|nr:hypothetical protein PSUM_04155 [Pseudomonas umsongensis]
MLPFCWAGTPAFEKGSRRKGETIGGRYRSNGYVLRQQSPTGHWSHLQKITNFCRSIRIAIVFNSPPAGRSLSISRQTPGLAPAVARPCA